MKVLWLCNLILPEIARELGLEASNKEGWVAGLAEIMLREQKQNQIKLAVASPVPERFLSSQDEILTRELTVQGGEITFFGFAEDVGNPHLYDEGLEKRLAKVMEMFEPEVIHCFGTEFPHTLAACRAAKDRSRILITIQGLCAPYADAYEADLPERVIKRKTFRDLLKRDDIPTQKEKFRLRGIYEREAVSLAGTLGGRTAWDRGYGTEWNPEARYFVMKETLRSNFYEGRWEKEKCEEHSIFLSQGDYPIKGLHYMLAAMPGILEKYPDAKVYVAGNKITAYQTWKEKLKLSSYGKYLRELMAENHLENKVIFLGKLNSAQMKEQYLKSNLFVCPSSIENSPNSLGEAMLLGMPCVTADVGGILSIFDAGKDGVVYEGFRALKQEGGGEALQRIAGNLADAVLEIWSDPGREKAYCESAREHALRNHNGQENYLRTLEVYAEVAGGSGKSGKLEET